MIKNFCKIKPNNYTILIILIFLFQTSKLFCQTEFEVSSPRLSFAENRLTIEYDILNSVQKNLFNVWVIITDDAGNSLDPVSLSGDIGNNITNIIGAVDNISTDGEVRFKAANELFGYGSKGKR